MPPGMPAPMMGNAGAPPMVQPTAVPAEKPEPESDGSYEICIKVMKDGTFHVYKDMESEEMAPEGGEDMMSEEGESAEGGEIFDSFEDALKGAVRLYRANPISDAPMAQMKAGYGPEEGR